MINKKYILKPSLKRKYSYIKILKLLFKIYNRKKLRKVLNLLN